MLAFQARPPGEPPVPWLVAALAVTVALLAADAWTGKTHRRRLHVVCVLLTWPSLAVAIWLAERTGGYYHFPVLPLRIHLTFAYSASVAALVASTSGVLHLYGRVRRALHARLAWAFLMLAVAASATGTWIFAVGVPKP
jgi:hypothetical protein